MDTTHVVAERLPGRVTVLCGECGAVRDVSARFIGSGGQVTRRLVCQTCHRPQTHWRVGLGDDDREAANRAGDTADLLARVQHTEDMFLRLGVDLYDWDHEPGGPRAEICHDIGPGVDRWSLLVDTDLTLDNRLKMLCWAWQAMVSIDQRGQRSDWHDLDQYQPVGPDVRRLWYQWDACPGTTVTERLAQLGRV